MTASGPGKVERWRSDRAVRASIYAFVALIWGINAVTEGGVWIVATAGFAFVAGYELVVWRRDGRHVRPVSTLPPDLTPEQQGRVATLVELGDNVAAIRLVRQETGAGLLAAKRAVDGVTAAGTT